MYIVDGTNISQNMAPGESQIPYSLALEPKWEALVFPKVYPTRRNNINEE